jgi:hypothetical protein
MSAIYPLSIQRRIEREWARRIKSLKQIRDQILVATEWTLQRAFKNESLFIPVAVGIGVDRRWLKHFQPHD